METMACPGCGVCIGEDEIQCPFCGVSFYGEGEDQECPECGECITEDDDECPECGECITEDDDECPECGVRVPRCETCFAILDEGKCPRCPKPKKKVGKKTKKEVIGTNL